MPGCRFEIFVSSYIDGELSAQERALFEKHLEECETCRTLMAEWKEVESALRRQALRRALGGEGQVAESVRDELSRSGAFRRARRRSTTQRLGQHLAARWPAYAAFGALVAAAAGAVFWLAPMVGGGHQSDRPIAPAVAMTPVPPTLVDVLGWTEEALDSLVRESRQSAGSPLAACNLVRDRELPTALSYWRQRIAVDGGAQDRLARMETVLALMASLSSESDAAEARAVALAVDRAGLLNEVRALQQKFMESVY